MFRRYRFRHGKISIEPADLAEEKRQRPHALKSGVLLIIKGVPVNQPLEKTNHSKEQAIDGRRHLD
ncbi:MAG: hypothetical protein GYB64_13855 [Chloroflexi bacterium]|nr:hypothetical protein [Chloroflexota bacterium]